MYCNVCILSYMPYCVSMVRYSQHTKKR